MKLVLTGIQGSGKSTQGNLLSKQFKIPYLSTGHIFRQLAKGRTKSGRYIKVMMNAGLLIPDDKTIEIVNLYISRPEYRKGYIIDGFPRTLKQAKEFKNNVDKVIYLEIPDKEALWRISRRNNGGRDDETLEALRKRIDLFHKATEPVISYYEKQGKLIRIDGTKSIEEINHDILKSLGKQLVKDQLKGWKKKEKSIIAIVGLAGSGKTEAAKFFAQQKKLPIINFGKIIIDYIDKNKLPHTEEVHKRVREDLRKEHGIEAFAVLNIDNIKKVLEGSSIIVLDGMRSWEEYLFLKKELPSVKIYILCLYVDKNTRYKRLQNKTEDKKPFGAERDLNELIGLNMAPTLAYADFLVKNNFEVADLHDKLEQVYRAVYFS